ncbi:hypothetical protein F5Y14DRAFT_452016 [Nemania sp. NC0429]|nr:hypothetical protein F5Y14DRAFT_452016 [Nemania sp. NC0429]
MPLELQDVDFEDGEAISLLQLSVFYDDIFNKTLFPGMSFDSLLAAAVARWPNDYSEPGCRYKKVVDTTTDEIVSFTKWKFINTHEDVKLPGQTGVPSSYIPSSPRAAAEGRDVQFSTDFVNKCLAIKTPLVGDRARMELHTLVTMPSHRRRGAASLMLEWATKFADQNGLICWTTASKEGLPLYQSFGFEIRGLVEMPMIDGSTSVSTCILRECRPCVAE